MLGRTLRFAYKQTFGQWSFGDLTCGVRHHMRREGNLEVASVYAGSNSVELQGPEILAELIQLQRLLTLCFSLTRDTYRVFLKSGGFTKEDVILKQLKALFLKPSFTILRDRNSKSFLLFIRGAISIRDKMTASYGPPVPFHHIILDQGQVHKVVLGYAHCGMVVAARWAAKHATPYLRKALNEHPEYDIKVIGHSMGAGIAALLTYILREQREFSSTTCIAYGPACCMTWDLAESANHFVTSIVNATDLVPTFEAITVRNLRDEVGASSWIQQTTLLNVIHRIMVPIKSHLTSSSTERTRAGGDKFLKPVSNSTKVVIRHAKKAAKAVVKSSSSLTSWSCAARRQQVRRNLDKDNKPSSLIASNSDSIVREWFSKKSVLDKLVRNSKVSDSKEIDERITRVLAAASVEQMTEVQFWYMLEKELHRQDDEDIEALKEAAAAAAAAAEIKEEKVLMQQAFGTELPLLPNGEEELQFWPPGRMLHMVALPALDRNTGEDALRNRRIGIYKVPREMYGKIRLSQTMIKDHYMDRYQAIMELLIHKLKAENNISAACVI